MVRQFTKKRVTVSAVQWTGGNLAEVREFCGHARFGPCPPDEPQRHDPEITAHVFDVLHDTWVGVKTGQWIIRGVNGEFYPIAEDVLAAAYEPAGDVRIAKEIRVERDEQGAPRIIIDGEPLPWFTSGIVTPAPSLNEAPTVTITLLAEKVTMVNNFPQRLGGRKRTP